jgi:hypothetical protein
MAVLLSFAKLQTLLRNLFTMKGTKAMNLSIYSSAKRMASISKLFLFLFFFCSVLLSQAQQTWDFGGNDATDLDYFGTHKNDLNIITADIIRMTLKGSSEPSPFVGIGTQNPNYNIQLHSEFLAPAMAHHGDDYGDVHTQTSQSFMQFTNLESGREVGDGLLVGMQGYTCYFQTMDKVKMRFRNNASIMDFYNYGRVDFFSNSTDFDGRVNIDAESNNGLLVRKMTGEGSYGIQVKTSSQVPVDALSIKQDNEVRFVVKNDGQVGVGTDNPNAEYMLDVRGKIRGCEVRVNNASGWCDFVFAKDYKLMPLALLAKYIDENHHLPEMPSEAEVTALGGFDVSEMTHSLLQRSEENTLYILQLEQELQLQQQKTSNLEQALAEMQAKLELLAPTK